MNAMDILTGLNDVRDRYIVTRKPSDRQRRKSDSFPGKDCG